MLSKKNECKKSQRPALLVIVRHAESERNKIKKDQTYFADEEARKSIKGIPDNKISLTAEGIEQAKKTGPALYKRFGHFDYAYHSGYLRTEQTLENILKAWPEKERNKIKIRNNPFIRERHGGYAYDMTDKEAALHFPWLKDYWKTFGGFFAQPPGGESLANVVERIYLFINMLFRDRVGQKVMIVTHGGTLRCLRFILEHWNYDQALKWPAGKTPKNCGVTVYEYNSKEKRLKLNEYNKVYWQ